MGAIKSKFFRSKSNSRKGKGDKPEKGKKQKEKTVNLPDSQSSRKTVDPRLPFSNYRQLFSIRNAWKAIQRSMEECATETFIRFLTMHPHYKEKFSGVIADIQQGDLEELRKQQEFEDKAIELYIIFDGVISDLEAVDKALQEIKVGVASTQFSRKMVKDYEASFIDTIKFTLGSDRFTQTTEDNFHLLYGFVKEEMYKLMEEETEEEESADGNVVADTQVEVNLCTDEAT